jgi:hypothetical protein
LGLLRSSNQPLKKALRRPSTTSHASTVMTTPMRSELAELESESVTMPDGRVKKLHGCGDKP